MPAIPHALIETSWCRPSWLRRAALLAGGIALLTLSSKVQVPLWPVPITMQSYMVLLIGALYGLRLGCATVLLWLTLALAGLPVLSGAAAAGPTYFLGPTGGYLLAFPLACASASLLTQRAPRRLSTLYFAAVMLLGHSLCLLSGWAWLALHIGLEAAYRSGVAPFLVGSAIKSLFGACSLALLRKIPFSHSGDPS